MRRLACLVFFAFSWATPGIAQTGVNKVEHWTAKDMDALEKSLTNASKSSGTEGKELLNVPVHRISIRYREQSLDAEQHRDLTDIIIIKSGTAGLVIGGELVGRTGTADEPRSTSITGGRRYPATAGDVFNIPPGIPHQWSFERGQGITYYVIKVRDKIAAR